MSGNPLHGLIDTLTQFISALTQCHHASKNDEKEQTLNDWQAVSGAFWQTYRFPDEAIRGLADPVLAWCSQKGFRNQDHIATIENAAHFVTELAKRTVPCALPELFADYEARKQWDRQDEFLLAALRARSDLSRLAALTGEVWRGDHRARTTNRAETQQSEASDGDKNRAEAKPIAQSSVNPVDSIGKRGETAEALVRQYLATHPNPQMDEAMQITSLTEQKIRRTQAWKDHEESLLDDYLRSHPDAETPDVEREFGFSPSKTVGMAAWRAHMERNEASKPPRKIKERPLTDATAKCRPDEHAVDPRKPAEVRDELFRAILEKAVPDTRGHMNKLSQAERDGLLDHLLRTVGFDASDGLDRERILTTALEVTESWLDNHEQEIRERNRKDRNR
jgi:hypothetical protein